MEISVNSNLSLLCALSSAAAILSMAPAHAAGDCKAQKMELPVTLSGNRALVDARINGQDVKFIFDSGAFYSTISAATAAQFGLKLSNAPSGIYITGMGGAAQVSVATVKEFTLAGVPIRNKEFVVGGSESGTESVGLLGQDIVWPFDVEYDFSHAAMRLFLIEGCKQTRLAYWLTPDQSYSLLNIEKRIPGNAHTIAEVYLNGKKIRAMFDSGAQRSVLTLSAAKSVGVGLDAPGVEKAGFWGGIGRARYETYIAPFTSFKVGDAEEIQNARLRIADTEIPGADMLVGFDFFLSHRIFVANSQRKMYITYNGGPVFNLTKTPIEVASTEAKPDVGELTEAAEFARRGAAFAERRDYEHALADLTKACELDPDESDHFYRRGMVYWQTKQGELALADFDRAISLKPDFVSALIARAEFRLASKDMTGAVADLDAVDRSAPRQANIRLTLAALYGRAEQPPSAIVQFDLWIANHPDDSRLLDALSGSCWARTMQNTELDKALSDCNKAVSHANRKANLIGYAGLLQIRGYTRLRRGEFGKAISDFDDSLKDNPKNASSFYGRGIAKLRMTNTAAGQADIAAAIGLQPQIADYYNRHGITP
jgi:tetratricopeptide (TPR) repeat protein/predicted aspartyl protease